MSDLIVFNHSSSVSAGNLTNYVEHIRAAKKWLRFPVNGEIYFYFSFGGRTLFISEYLLGLLICSGAFVGIVAIRLLIRRFRIRKKVINLIKRLRAGADETNVVGYETTMTMDDIKDNTNIGDQINLPIPIAGIGLSTKEELIKSILKKCFKPNRIYRITNSSLINILSRMVMFKNKNIVRMVSYEVLTLALVVVKKIGPTTAYTGIIEAFANTAGIPMLIQTGPLIVACLMGGLVGAKMSLDIVSITTLLRTVAAMIANYTLSYRLIQSARTFLLIDCQDYVKELPNANAKYIGPGQTSEEIYYTRNEPVKEDMYVSTKPNAELYYQNDHEFETLDGKWTERTQLNGQQSVQWGPNRKRVSPTSSYVPLKARTKTLADLNHLDTTDDRKSAQRIVRSVQRAQVIEDHMDEILQQFE